MYNEKRSCKPQSIRQIFESMAAQKEGFFGVLNQLFTTNREGGLYECR